MRRSRSRSRSPLGEYKHHSSGWRSLADKSTEVCSDFASGRCRRGSQCKYFHPKDSDASESRRSRADHGNDSKQRRFPRNESRGDVSDPYQGEDEQFQNNSKNAVPCRNFIKGKCRWGDSCRFSHHDETSVEGAKRSSPEKDAEHQPYRNRNLICKYFAAGKCDRDNCRFSHEDSKFNSLERKQEKVNSDRSSREKGNKRNGLRWDDSGRIPDDMKPSNRNNSSVFTDTDNSNEGLNNRISHSLGDENIYDGLVENNLVSSFHPEVIDEVEDSRNATDRISLSGQTLQQNGENLFPGLSSVSMEAASEHVDNLNFQSQIQNLQNAIQMTGMPETNTSLSFPNSESTEHSTQYIPMTNPVMFPNQRFENENSGKKAVAEVSNSTGMVLSMSNAAGHDPLDSVENGRSSDENENRKVEGHKMPPIADSGTNNSEIEHSGRSKVEQETAPEIPEFDEGKEGIGEENKGVQESKQTETVDEKGMRLFKNSLIEFVKEILKPTWKEGRMSREVHKTIVKKVVDKITSAIQTEHIPKTQEKVEQYLSFSKPKIAKLVQVNLCCLISF